jgi:hypothetical protein
MVRKRDLVERRRVKLVDAAGRGLSRREALNFHRVTESGREQRLFQGHEKKLAPLASRGRVRHKDGMDTRDAFFNVSVPEAAIQGMGKIIDQARVFGLKEWFDSLDAEFVTDLVSAWEVWKAQQAPLRPEAPTTPKIPEETIPPPSSSVPPSADARRVRVKFKSRKLAHLR